MQLATVAALLALIPATCTATAPTVTPSGSSPAASAVTPAPIPTREPASAPVPATPPPPRAPKRPLGAWTDPDAVTMIEADCAAAAPALPDGPSPLSCTLPFDQSCAYDPCFHKEQNCRALCSTTCGTCDASCTSSCSACKTTCKDDTCRRECAAKTGVCKQACVGSLDRCSTADCAKAAKVCAEDEYDRWKAHACSCDPIIPCIEPCMHGKGDVDACLDRCRAKHPHCDIGYCLQGDGHPYPPRND